jgi:hypothetical protein
MSVLIGSVTVSVYLQLNGEIAMQQSTEIAPAFKSAQLQLTETEKQHLVVQRNQGAHCIGSMLNDMVKMAESKGWTPGGQKQ